MRNVFQVLIVATAVFGLGLGAAFGGGVFYGRRTAPETPAAAAPTAGAPGGGGAGATTAGGAPTGGGGLPGGGAGAPTTGVVEEINGDTVTVRTQAGGTVAIKLQGDTQVRQLAPAAPADIKPGLGVIVTGQPDVDGKVAARSVQITGPAAQGSPGGQAGPRGSGDPPARPASPRP